MSSEAEPSQNNSNSNRDQRLDTRSHNSSSETDTGSAGSSVFGTGFGGGFNQGFGQGLSDSSANPSKPHPNTTVARHYDPETDTAQVDTDRHTSGDFGPGVQGGFETHVHHTDVFTTNARQQSNAADVDA
jgi:cytoskeletal protein RodZ